MFDQPDAVMPGLLIMFGGLGLPASSKPALINSGKVSFKLDKK